MIPRSVGISGDALRSFPSAGAADFLGNGSTYRASAHLANFYLAAGASVVLIDFVFETPASIDYCRRHLEAGYSNVAVTLWAPLDELVARDSCRTGAAKMGPRVASSVQRMQSQLAGFGHVESTSAKSIPDVCAAILRFASRPPPGQTASASPVREG